jgi:hypothetical protein
MPERALLNDRNPHLIHFYSWLKRGLQVTVPMANDEGLFYAHRRRFSELLVGGGTENVEAAALFYYLNRTGFNGLCRFNGSGEFNVPFGRYKRINYARDFTPYHQLFANWDFIILAILNQCRSSPMTSSMPIRLMTFSSPNTPKKRSIGRTKCALPNGWPGTGGGSSFRTRLRTGPWRCTESSAFGCAFSTRHGGSVARVTAGRPKRCWREGM